MTKTRIVLAAALVLGFALASPASAQQAPFKQKQGQWSEETCRKNAVANNYGSGVDFCAAKAQRIKAKGKRVIVK